MRNPLGINCKDPRGASSYVLHFLEKLLSLLVFTFLERQKLSEKEPIPESTGMASVQWG